VTFQPTVPPPFPSAEAEEKVAIERLLDANLDRAREGLRVLEDWARFALERPDLVARCKDLRQRLGRLHRQRYKFARHTATDPAAGLAHPAQAERQDGGRVLAANAARVQEALRVLEEFGRLEDSLLASEAAAIRYALYDLEVDLLQAGRGGDERRALLRRCHLYLVTSPVPDLEAVVAAALAAGVRLVQYRAKAEDATGAGAPADDRARFAQASALRQLCHRHGALFLVNDRIDLALAVGADGVHLGQGDLPPAIARRLLGPDRLIGRSTHRLEELRRAVADGCDYVGVGPVNATPTKPGREPVGLAYVAQAAAECPLPFFAIGGIDATNLEAVRRVGGDRVAVVRAITAAPDPGAAAVALLAGLEAGA
jgi:thiamine-phosphate pyrophosphorylase